MNNITIEQVRAELRKQGLDLKPINRDNLSIKDEPKYEIIKIK